MTKFITPKTDWQNAMKLEDDEVGKIKKPEVITTPGPNARAFIELDRAVTSRCRVGDNRVIFEKNQTEQVKTSW